MEEYILKRNNQPVSVLAPTLNTVVMTSVGRLQKRVKHENNKEKYLTTKARS